MYDPLRASMVRRVDPTAPLMGPPVVTVYPSTQRLGDDQSTVAINIPSWVQVVLGIGIPVAVIYAVITGTKDRSKS